MFQGVPNQSIVTLDMYNYKCIEASRGFYYKSRKKARSCEYLAKSSGFRHSEFQEGKTKILEDATNGATRKPNRSISPFISFLI